jgi:hypothetical protein
MRKNKMTISRKSRRRRICREGPHSAVPIHVRLRSFVPPGNNPIIGDEGPTRGSCLIRLFPDGPARLPSGVHPCDPWSKLPLRHSASPSASAFTSLHPDLRKPLIFHLFSLRLHRPSNLVGHAPTRPLPTLYASTLYRSHVPLKPAMGRSKSVRAPPCQKSFRPPFPAGSALLCPRS